jgi:hypothetical protein
MPTFGRCRTGSLLLSARERRMSFEVVTVSGWLTFSGHPTIPVAANLYFSTSSKGTWLSGLSMFVLPSVSRPGIRGSPFNP